MGLGHVARLGAVAAALRERGIEPSCAGHGASAPLEHGGTTWEPLAEEEIPMRAAGADAVVLDSYTIAEPVATALARESRLVAMHDHGEPRAGAALLIAPGLERPPAGGPSGARWLTGLGYAPLGPGFWELPPPRVSDGVTSALITTGASDPGGVAERLAAAVAAGLPDARVVLVQGPQAELTAPSGVVLAGPFGGMLEPLRAADLVVCGAGHTMLEACAVGTPRVVVVFAENQEAGARRLEELGAIRRVDPRDPERLGNGVRELAADRDAREAMAASGQAAVDGRGALRIATEIERISG